MDLQLGRAFNIVSQTMPYVLYRAMIYGALCGAGLVYLAILGLIGAVFGSGAFMVLFLVSVGAGAVLGLGRLLGEYFLYLLKAGHIALITEIISEGTLPEGINQTEWAKSRVQQYFKEISVLSLIDQLVKGVIGFINRTLFDVMTILPIPGLEGAAKFAQRVVDFSLTYVDESIIAYTFKTKNENIYDAAKTGIVLYAQGWKGILKNAVALTLLSYVFVLICTLVWLIPFGAVALMLPAAWSTTKFILFILALFLGFSCKWIFFDPIACTSTILTFLKEAEGAEANAEWEERIEQVCGKFRELKEKAAQKFQEMGAKPAEQPEV